jgi:hypothetical protein
VLGVVKRKDGGQPGAAESAAVEHGGDSIVGFENGVGVAHDPEERDPDRSAMDIVHEAAPVLDAISTDSDVAFDSEFSSNVSEAASTDKPSSDPAVTRANSTDADDSVFSFMTARASILTGEALESGKGGDSDLQGNHLVDFDRLSTLPDALLRDIVSRLPIKEAARRTVLSRR